jgi:hypothetical protein
MMAGEATELVAPEVVGPGDVIEDPVAPRWLTVTQVQTAPEGRGGLFSFYGDGPYDRITFEGADVVTRRKTR